MNGLTVEKAEKGPDCTCNELMHTLSGIIRHGCEYMCNWFARNNLSSMKSITQQEFHCNTLDKPWGNYRLSHFVGGCYKLQKQFIDLNMFLYTVKIGFSYPQSHSLITLSKTSTSITTDMSSCMFYLFFYWNCLNACLSIYMNIN